MQRQVSRFRSYSAVKSVPKPLGHIRSLLWGRLGEFAAKPGGTSNPRKRLNKAVLTVQTFAKTAAIGGAASV